MNLIVHVLVFFISISTEPTHPGPGKYGTGVTWVLYGAPSEQKAREWAQAQYNKMHSKDDVAQTIKEFLVLPVGDTLYTQRGSELVQWTSLPGVNDLKAGDNRDQEFGSTATIQPPNKSQRKPGEMKDMTLEQLRALMEKQSQGQVQWNWDESKPWYYIFYTSKEATLVKSVNMFAAAIPYIKGVRGTALGDASARIEAWQGLTKYGE